MTTPTYSICIVTYQARDYLRDCLNSLHANQPDKPFEIIVVDNGSTDGTQEMMAGEFPQIELIKNLTNKGYTAPMNQALRASHGDLVMQLNPDTLIKPQTFQNLDLFLEAHPEVGICGPKVVNPDGTLQKPCRRGESRPWAVISYFTGLSRVFPDSKTFGEYHLSYLDEDEIHPVAGVSGSCMVIRRAVIDQIGFLDERFFAYQEDADYCFQARQVGWQVYYVPTAQVVHYGGEGGSQVHQVRSILAWHKSYWLYYRKNLARDYFFLFNWFYYGLMALKLLQALFMNLIRRGKFASKKHER